MRLILVVEFEDDRLEYGSLMFPNRLTVHFALI